MIRAISIPLVCFGLITIMLLLSGCWKPKASSGQVELEKEVTIDKFIFFIPKTWKIRNPSDKEIEVASWDGSVGMDLMILPFGDSVEKFVENFVNEFEKKKLSDFKVIQKIPFVTHSGLEGVKLVMEWEAKPLGMQIHIFVYCFQFQGELLQFYSAEISDEALYEPLLDSIVQSFAFKQK